MPASIHKSIASVYILYLFDNIVRQFIYCSSYTFHWLIFQWKSYLFHRCKERLTVNGMTGKVKYIDGNTIFVETANAMVPVFPVYTHGQEYFPIVARYASTIHKVMGQTLQHVTLAFDMRMLSPAVGYVALSRVSSLDNVVPLLRLRKSHFINT